MAECKKCRKRNWNPFEDICSDCLIDVTVAKTKADGAAERELAQQDLDAILVTTAYTLQGIEVTKYLGVLGCYR